MKCTCGEKAVKSVWLEGVKTELCHDCINYWQSLYDSKGMQLISKDIN